METLDEKLLSDKAPIFKVAFNMLKHAMKDILYGNCDEEDVIDVVAKLNPENNDYFRQEDFVNTDKAMEMLQLGKNRVKFFQLTKEYHIESKKISNMPVGFLKKDIKKLMRILKDEAKDINKTSCIKSDANFSS